MNIVIFGIIILPIILLSFSVGFLIGKKRGVEKIFKILNIPNGSTITSIGFSRKQE